MGGAKWTDDERHAVIEGVGKHGVDWRAIEQDPALKARLGRIVSKPNSNVMLKDQWRTIQATGFAKERWPAAMPSEPPSQSPRKRGAAAPPTTAAIPKRPTSTPASGDAAIAVRSGGGSTRSAAAAAMSAAEPAPNAPPPVAIARFPEQIWLRALTFIVGAPSRTDTGSLQQLVRTRPLGGLACGARALARIVHAARADAHPQLAVETRGCGRLRWQSLRRSCAAVQAMQARARVPHWGGIANRAAQAKLWAALCGAPVLVLRSQPTGGMPPMTAAAVAPATTAAAAAAGTTATAAAAASAATATPPPPPTRCCVLPSTARALTLAFGDSFASTDRSLLAHSEATLSLLQIPAEQRRRVLLVGESRWRFSKSVTFESFDNAGTVPCTECFAALPRPERQRLYDSAERFSAANGWTIRDLMDYARHETCQTCVRRATRASAVLHDALAHATERGAPDTDEDRTAETRHLPPVVPASPYSLKCANWVYVALLREESGELRVRVLLTMAQIRRCLSAAETSVLHEWDLRVLALVDP